MARKRIDVGMTFEALLLDDFLSRKETQDILDGPEPELSPEDEILLSRIGSDLPNKIKAWRAADQGCVIPTEEEISES
jgi:hypothetical protein